MKKLLFILAATPLFALAQKEYTIKEYCYVMPIKNRAEILTEQTKKFVHITDSVGNDIRFETSIEIFNYMSKQGWELHPAQPLVINTGGSLVKYLFYRIREEGE